MSGCQMVWISNGGLKTGQKMLYIHFIELDLLSKMFGIWMVYLIMWLCRQQNVDGYFAIPFFFCPSLMHFSILPWQDKKIIRQFCRIGNDFYWNGDRLSKNNEQLLYLNKLTKRKLLVSNNNMSMYTTKLNLPGYNIHKLF